MSMKAVNKRTRTLSEALGALAVPAGHGAYAPAWLSVPGSEAPARGWALGLDGPRPFAAPRMVLSGRLAGVLGASGARLDLPRLHMCTTCQECPTGLEAKAGMDPVAWAAGIRQFAQADAICAGGVSDFLTRVKEPARRASYDLRFVTALEAAFSQAGTAGKASGGAKAGLVQKDTGGKGGATGKGGKAATVNTSRKVRAPNIAGCTGCLGCPGDPSKAIAPSPTKWAQQLREVVDNGNTVCRDGALKFITALANDPSLAKNYDEEYIDALIEAFSTDSKGREIDFDNYTPPPGIDEEDVIIEPAGDSGAGMIYVAALALIVLAVMSRRAPSGA